MFAVKLQSRMTVPAKHSSEAAGVYLRQTCDDLRHRACVGDLVTLEVQKAGLHGIVIWELHRDTDELVSIGLPLLSLDTMGTGPQRLDPFTAQRPRGPAFFLIPESGAHAPPQRRTQA
jgi:hypothetical protein